MSGLFQDKVRKAKNRTGQEKSINGIRAKQKQRSARDEVRKDPRGGQGLLRGVG